MSLVVLAEHSRSSGGMAMRRAQLKIVLPQEVESLVQQHVDETERRELFWVASALSLRSWYAMLIRGLP